MDKTLQTKSSITVSNPETSQISETVTNSSISCTALEGINDADYRMKTKISLV